MNCGVPSPPNMFDGAVHPQLLWLKRAGPARRSLTSPLELEDDCAAFGRMPRARLPARVNGAEDTLTIHNRDLAKGPFDKWIVSGVYRGPGLGATSYTTVIEKTKTKAVQTARRLRLERRGRWTVSPRYLLIDAPIVFF